MAARRRSPLDIQVTEAHQCSVELRLKILGKVPFFQGLSLADLQRLNSLFTEKGYDAEAMICFAGDPAEHLFILADGRVKLLRHSTTGKDIVLDILAAGEFFGVFSGSGVEVYSDSAQAQTPVCILTISRNDFRRILDQNPTVALKVLDIMTDRLRAANERVHQLSVYPVERRLANVLIDLVDKFGEPSKVGLLIQVPLSREDLAALAGTTTETASRVLSQFQRDGLVKAGREWVAVVDRIGLTRLAGDDWRLED